MTTAGSNGALPEDARSAAPFYLGQGYISVPIPRVGDWKGPRLPGWQDLRPTPEDLDALFPEGEPLNIGLLLGQPSGGLIDVDMDWPEAVAVGPFFLPPTGRVSGRSGKPKSHFWYRCDRPPNKASEFYDDPIPADTEKKRIVELRSTGAQTVVPPSIHKTGEHVIWHSFDNPAEVDVEELRGAVRRIAAAASLARHWPTEGGRQDSALSIAGGLARAGWDGAAINNFVRAVATAAGDVDEMKMRCNVGDRTVEKVKRGAKVWGWPKLAELLGRKGSTVVEQACAWLGIRHEKEKAPIHPPAPFRHFPVETLPEPIRTFVVQGAAALGCDPTYLALPALSVAASLIGNSRVIRLKRNWYEAAVVWSGIVGDSGTLKSPAISAVVGPLYRLQKQLIRQFKADRVQYEKDKAAYDERKRQAKKDGKQFDEEPPEEPTLARVVTGDITVEKLAQLLEDNPKGLLTCRDELGGWLGSFTRYKGKAGGSDLPNWLEMSRAGTIQVDRKTGDRPTLFITYAAVSITGGIQPGALARALTPEYMEVGLGARLLMSMPPKLQKRWSEVEIDPDVQDAYEKTLHALRELQMDKGRESEKEPFPVRMTPEAKALWVRFYGEWAKVQAAVEGELAAAYSKLEGYAARLALIHHVVSHVGRGEDDCQPVEPVSIEAGITLARWFAYELRRIYTTLAETEDQKHVRKLVELIRSWGGSTTVRKLQKASGNRYPTAEDAEATLKELVDAGLADWCDLPAGPRGGRPTRICILKPETDTTKTDTTPDDDDPEDDDGDDGVPTKPPDNTPSVSGSLVFGVVFGKGGGA